MMPFYSYVFNRNMQSGHDINFLLERSLKSSNF